VNTVNTSLFNAGVIVRITALWAFSEAFLGGILHGFKVPFAGLALSLVAAICMVLIAANENAKGVILRATLIVIAVKFILSPHTPPMAYAAVLIEGLAGEIFLIKRRALRTGAFVLTLFCLLYSALQHLLILTVVFGKDFWNALDLFLNGITKTFVKGSQHYSVWLVLFYIGCYLLAGVAGGIFCSRLIKKIQSGGRPPIVDEFAGHTWNDESKRIAATTTKSKRAAVRYGIAFLLFLMLLLSYTPLFKGTVLTSKAGAIILRGLLIMLVWNFLVAPLLIKAIGKWVEKYKTQKANTLQEILALLPGIKMIVQFSWQKATGVNKYKRLQHFLSNTVMLIVHGR
jgi:hypothetical protein